MNVGARIAQLRVTRNISQYALWKRSGIAQGALSQYEAGQKTPGIDTLERICAGLGITLAEFFSVSDDPHAPPLLALCKDEQDLICNYRRLTQEQQQDCQDILRMLASKETK